MAWALWTPDGARRAFCMGMGLAFLAAFTSLYVQYPGLYGHDGIQPAGAFADRVARHYAGSTTDSDGSLTTATSLLLKLPTVLWFRHEIGVDVDTCLELVCIVGIAVSLLNSVGYGCTASFAVAWFLYLSVYVVGQTFLSFQWDILLLEVGACARLLLHPNDIGCSGGTN